MVTKSMSYLFHILLTKDTDVRNGYIRPTMFEWGLIRYSIPQYDHPPERTNNHSFMNGQIVAITRVCTLLSTHHNFTILWLGIRTFKRQTFSIWDCNQLLKSCFNPFLENVVRLTFFLVYKYVYYVFELQ